MPSPFETGPGQFQPDMTTLNSIADPVVVDEDDAEPSISDLIRREMHELFDRVVGNGQDNEGLDTSPGASNEVINGGEEAPIADVIPLLPGITELEPVESDPPNINGIELDISPGVAEINGTPVDGEDLSLGGLTAIIEQRPAA